MPFSNLTKKQLQAQNLESLASIYLDAGSPIACQYITQYLGLSISKSFVDLDHGISNTRNHMRMILHSICPTTNLYLHITTIIPTPSKNALFPYRFALAIINHLQSHGTARSKITSLGIIKYTNLYTYH